MTAHNTAYAQPKVQEPLLQAEGLSKLYQRRRSLFGARETLSAVDGVSLELFAGEILGVVGESGCGKSTLARLLVNMERPTSGDVRFQGRSTATLDRPAWRSLRRQLQIAFQDTRRSLDPRMRILAQVREPLDIHNLGDPGARDERAAATLADLGLDAQFWSRFPHQLSGGQCQRVVLARAMVLTPEVLICDEPTSAADVSVQAQVVNLLRRLRDRRGLAILFISHNLGLVKYLCDRIAVMYMGEVVEAADRRQLFAEPLHPYTRALLSAVPSPRPRSAIEQSARRDGMLVGEPPNPAKPPSGCRFHPRCPLAFARCRRDRPALKATASGRLVACHLVHGELGQEGGAA